MPSLSPKVSLNIARSYNSGFLISIGFKVVRGMISVIFSDVWNDSMHVCKW